MDSFFRVSAEKTCDTLTSFKFVFFSRLAKTGLHLPFAREFFVMQKRIAMAARLIILVLMASIASCQSGRSGATAGSRAEVTDPNTVFSQGGAHANATPGSSSQNSPRKGRGLSGGF
jgi:hypothetical protein